MTASEQTMDGDSIGKMSADRERLKSVTELLSSGQGLSAALTGTLLFLLNTDEPWHWLKGWGRIWAGLAWAALLVGGLRIAYLDWIPEYNQRRFGSAQAAQKPWSKWGARFFLAFLVLLFVGWPIAHYLDLASRLHVMMSDPARQIDLWPSLFWLLLLCRSLRWRLSSIEHQRACFMLAGMISSASIVFYSIWHPEAKQLALWKLLNSGGLGLSLIAMGLYDHFVLVRALPKRVGEGDDE